MTVDTGPGDRRDAGDPGIGTGTRDTAPLEAPRSRDPHVGCWPKLKEKLYSIKLPFSIGENR
ncbi:MAG: hypothetical protein M3R46_07700 [Actinomycetota bacterium]|nr:hypothetical protein [Actinomycetota bacterium]